MRAWQVNDYETRRILSFGITEAIFGVALSGILGGGALGAIGADVIGGAAGGSLLSGITGSDPLKGALGGALTGGAAGAAGALGPGIAEAVGAPAAAVEAGIGGLGGAAGSLVSGGNPLIGAGVGALGGVAAGGTGAAGSEVAPAAAPTGSPTPPGAGASAAGIAGGAPSENFLGFTSDAGPAVGGGAGVGNISGPPSGGGGAGISGGPAGGGLDVGNTFFSPGTDTAVPGGASGGTLDIPAAGAGGSGVSDFIKGNWPTLASAGILGIQGLTGNKTLPEEAALRQHATNTAGQAQALMSPIQTGILPPGAKQAVDSATRANTAATKSTFANLGLGGSTMEAQAIQGVERNAAAQTFQIADQLLKSGIDLSRLSAADLDVLLNEQLKQDEQFQGALTSFAGGLAGARTRG